MRNRSVSAAAVAALILVPVALLAQSTSSTTKTTAKKKSAPAATKSATGTAKTPAAGAAKSGTTTNATARKKTSTTARRTTYARQTWRTRQLQPTAERYKEIQEALVSKGYLAGEQTGAWDQKSIGALQRFQLDQNLDATGKIDSLSLIALGLGPKHETVAAVPSQQPVPPAN
jgi:hypothetical protein